MITDFTKPFALIKCKNRRNVLLIQGDIEEVFSLDDINWEKPNLFVTPFCQIREKGYEYGGKIHPIINMKIRKQHEIDTNAFLGSLKDEEIVLESEIEYNHPDAVYKNIVKKIIEDEIGNGEGCNFVIPRQATAQIKDMQVYKVLHIFKKLILSEYGSHWTFLFFDAKQFFVGASPEAHLVVEKGKVRMHPISGTFRKNKYYKELDLFKKDFLTFLSDKKEINELFMVVDEELKMMAKTCSEGGIIVGPIIKEMAALIHTEYLLLGRSHKSLKDIFKETMYAATVVGGPLENACRINKKYEPEGRDYYGAAIVLTGEKDGKPYLDSSILIRTLNINSSGTVTARVGGTLVRNSVAEDELEEVKTKLTVVLNSIAKTKVEQTEKYLEYFEEDSDLLEKLYDRNKNLSKFWSYRQDSKDTLAAELQGKTITIIDNGDDFCYMLLHMLTSMGFEVNVVRYSSFKLKDDNSDLVVVGPGTGNPLNDNDPKMKILCSLTEKLLEQKRKFLAVCLGHQVLCRKLGIEVKHKDELYQGIPVEVDLFGKREIVGFYNTFTGLFPKNNIREDINLAYDNKKQIYAMRSKNFTGFQFHPESILTQNGFKILKEELKRLLGTLP